MLDEVDALSELNSACELNSVEQTALAIKTTVKVFKHRRPHLILETFPSRKLHACLEPFDESAFLIHLGRLEQID